MNKRKQKKSERKLYSERKFIFQATDRIGAAGAEDDSDFLDECFVDTGVLEILADVDDNRQIILGRTGSGKSALLKQLKKLKGSQVIEISPQDLAIKYLANSTILQFFHKLNINLDPFFKLLWRHVFTVEVLSRHFEIHPDLLQKKNDPWTTLKSFFASNNRQDKQILESIEYLKSWAERFWEETELGVKEITSKFESQFKTEISAGLNIDIASLASTLDGLDTLTDEVKQQLIQRGQNIISRTQVNDLTKVINLLDNIIDDRQKSYWIVIDDLDGDWVEDKLRFRLIMTLIQISREFSRINNAKTAIAIRNDLLERVFKLTRDSGFQEEKYRSLYLHLNWNGNFILKILDKRINLLGKNKTGRDDTHILTLLPKKINNINIKDYIPIIASRPRDVIALFNQCILVAVGKERLSENDFKTAEGQYSKLRLKALADEWDATYPRLLDFTELFIGHNKSFKINTLDTDKFTELCLNRETVRPNNTDEISLISHDVAYGVRKNDYTLTRLIHIFYRIGLLGLKPQPFEKESWSDVDGITISSTDIDMNTSVVIHPTFHRALGITQFN